MKFRKIPVVIEAEPYTKGMEDGFEERYIDHHNHPNQTFGIQASENDTPVQIPYIKTLEGRHLITKGDWIITGVKGERYPCKPDIFRMTYESIEDIDDDDGRYCDDVLCEDGPDGCSSCTVYD